MKIELPPKVGFDIDLFQRFIAGEYTDFLSMTDKKYLYWDEIKHRKDLPFPDDLNQNWDLVKLYRSTNRKKLAFSGTAFYFNLTTNLLKELHEFDLKLIGGLYKNPITRLEEQEYLKGSLLEEAIASSQIEGAATTTEVARDMLKAGRKPRTESEQMIFNNLRAIKFIESNVDEDLDKSLLIELHKIMTVNTAAGNCIGDYRSGKIYVQDYVDGEVVHIPPEADKVDDFMESLFFFANNETDFLHPIVKASIIHFMIGYIHPFPDGNGRTARSLFYWYLLKKEYSLIKNISISRAILESRIQYDKAYLKVEHDENDLTYFIYYSVKSLKVAFESLVRYRDKKKKDREQGQLIAYKLISAGMTKRKADVLGYLYSEHGKKNTVSLTSYYKKHDIVRQTARKDLSELVAAGFLQEGKKGKETIFWLHDPSVIDDFINQNSN